MTEDFVYFLRPVGQVGPIKIGHSFMPEKRLLTYSAWSPLKLELIATAPGGHAEELKLHCMFGESWSHHEWFEASDSLLALIEYVIEQGVLPDLSGERMGPLPYRKNKAGPSVAAMNAAQLARADYEGGMSLVSVHKIYGCGISAQTLGRGLAALGVKIRSNKSSPYP